ncbi:MAG: hypothetical protein VXZ38_03920 [Planctomycetota bacterium]|nr:hypothetical protein [Planctomycetota bacterium]
MTDFSLTSLSKRIQSTLSTRVTGKRIRFLITTGLPNLEQLLVDFPLIVMASMWHL